MGADIYIQTKKPPDLPDNKFTERNVINPEQFDEEYIHEIFEGQDYDTKSPVYYYRDSYNHTNLAWVKGLSYWILFHDDPEEFLRQIANTTDEEIEKYVDHKILMGAFKEDERDEIINYLKQKRDYLKALVEAGIKVLSYSI